MSQPNTAAITVASIFGGIALIFVAYKMYCKLWHCMYRPEQLPPISQPQTAYHGGVVMSTASDASVFAAINTHPSSNNYLAASSASTSTWQQADALASTSTSELPSPSLRPLDSVVLSTPSDVYDPHHRGTSTNSSSSSTMTLKRSYLRCPSASQLLTCRTPVGASRIYHTRRSIATLFRLCHLNLSALAATWPWPLIRRHSPSAETVALVQLTISPLGLSGRSTTRTDRTSPNTTGRGISGKVPYPHAPARRPVSYHQRTVAPLHNIARSTRSFQMNSPILQR